MLKLENCPATRSEWLWLKYILSLMLQRLKMIPLNQFFLAGRGAVSILHPVRASETVDLPSKLIKILWLTGDFYLCFVEG